MWKSIFSIQNNRYEIVDSDTGEKICQLPQTPLRGQFEITANLIASAPELFNELGFIIEFVEHSSIGENEQVVELLKRAKQLSQDIYKSKIRRPFDVRMHINNSRSKREFNQSSSHSFNDGSYGEVFSDRGGDSGTVFDGRHPNEEVYHDQIDNAPITYSEHAESGTAVTEVCS